MDATQFHSGGALRPKAACQFLSVSARTLAQWSKAGILVPLKKGEGKRKICLYPLALLEKFLAGTAQEN